MIEMTRYVHHVFSLWERCKALESRPLIFVYLYTRTQSIRKQIVEYHIRINYPEEYSTANKVGGEKRLARKSCLV